MAGAAGAGEVAAADPPAAIGSTAAVLRVAVACEARGNCDSLDCPL